MHFYLFLRSFVSLLVFNTFITSTLSQSFPRKRPGLQSPIIYPVGTHAYIECPVYDDESDMLFFEWSRGTDEPIEETHRIRINDRGVLKIKSATVEDSGLYYCKAINGFGSVTTSVELKIVPEEDLRGLSSPLDNQYPIQFPLNDNILSESEVSSDFSYMKTISHPIVSGSEATLLRKAVGVSVVLRCGAKSKVEWTKNGRHLSLKHLPNGSSKRKGVLILSKVGIEDSGNYSCVGTDESSGRVNKTFALIVYDNRKPELTVFDPINTSVVLGDRKVFHCKVHSQVKPLIQWLRSYTDVKDSDEAKSRGLIQINSEYYKVLKTKVIDDGNGNYLNDLVIEKTSLNDSANYICLAAHTISGTFNFTYKSTYLTVLPAFKLSPESSDSNDLTLPFSTIFWIFFGGISSIVMLSIGFFFFIEWIREKRNKTANNNCIQRGDNIIQKRDYSNSYYYKNVMTSPQTPYIPSNVVTNGDNCYLDNRLT